MQNERQTSVPLTKLKHSQVNSNKSKPGSIAQTSVGYVNQSLTLPKTETLNKGSINRAGIAAGYETAGIEDIHS